MTKEKTDALYAKYPEIFQEHALPMSQTAMCWGFECGDGWYGIIDALCERLMLVKQQKGVLTAATQVKEKFGTLRFYTRIEAPADQDPMVLAKIREQIFGLIDSFEMLSACVCEGCGATLNVAARSRRGWISTQCDACFAKSGPVKEDKP